MNVYIERFKYLLIYITLYKNEKQGEYDMKKMVLAIGIVIMLAMTSVVSANSVSLTSDMKLSTLTENKAASEQLNQVLKIKIGEIKKMLYEAIATVEPLKAKILLKERIESKFDVLYKAGLTDDVSLYDLLVDDKGNLLIDQNGNMICSADDSKGSLGWRFPLLTALLAVLNVNVLCDIDVYMSAGWVFSIGKSSPLPTEVIIGKGFTTSDNVLNDIPDMPRFIRFIITLVINSILVDVRQGTQRIRLAVGISYDTTLRDDAGKISGDPSFFPGLPLIQSFAVKIGLALGMHSYILKGRAWLVLGI